MPSSRYFACETLPLEPIFDSTVTASLSITLAGGPPVVHDADADADADAALRASRAARRYLTPSLQLRPIDRVLR
jgi:hypothetical protein